VCWTGRLPGVGQRLIKSLERAAHRAVHEREDDHDRGEDGRPPRHDEPDAERLEHPRADEPLRPQHAQQQIADHRGRQDEWQRQHDIENAFEQTRELGDVVRRGDPGEEYHDRGDGRDAQ